MFSLFNINRKNSWKAAIQAYNLLAMTIAIYELTTDPEASKSELVPDIATHLVSIISLQENVSCLAEFASILLNATRVGSIYTGVTLGGSSMSIAFNCMDAANHLINMMSPLTGTEQADSNTASAPTCK